MNNLIRFDAAKQALAECKRVDEVKSIRDKAMAMQLYARQAHDRSLEQDAIEISMQAERRLGEIIQEQKETVGLASGREGKRKSLGLSKNPSDRPTLDSQGIDKNLAHRARRLAGMSEKDFDAAVAAARGLKIKSKRKKKP